MTIPRSLAVVLSLFMCSVCQAQSSFDTTTVDYKRYKLGALYADLMEHAMDVQIVDSAGRVVKSLSKYLEGEATFVYEVRDDGSLDNIYITEFWMINTFYEPSSVKDYIVFNDGGHQGFDRELVEQHRLNSRSKEFIMYLFDFVWDNRKFKVIKPRERNLKYDRIRFE